MEIDALLISLRVIRKHYWGVEALEEGALILSMCSFLLARFGCPPSQFQYTEYAQCAFSFFMYLLGNLKFIEY